MPLERDININGHFWVEVVNPENPFTAMLILRSRGTCLILWTSSTYCPLGSYITEQRLRGLHIGDYTYTVQGSLEKRLTGKGGKLNTSQVEPVDANSWAVPFSPTESGRPNRSSEIYDIN